MEYVRLKNSDLSVSRICMGGCPMGGYGWGETREQDFIDAIHTAIDNGVNFFDTANTYGFGQSEETLGKGLGSRRHEVIIQSKFGVRVMRDMMGQKTVYDNGPDYIRKALEGTLQRLGTDYIDIYTIHYRDRSTPMEAVIQTLKTLRREGKVRYFGLSNIDKDGIGELRSYQGDFVCCQNEYSLACRKNEENLKLLESELCVTPLTWGSLGQGILTGKYDRNTKFEDSDRRSRAVYVNFHGQKMEKNLEIVEALKGIARERQKPVSAVALRFILDRFRNAAVLVGAKNSEQMACNLKGCDWELSPKEMELLECVSREEFGRLCEKECENEERHK